VNIDAKFNEDIFCDKLQKVALQHLLLNRNIDFISKFMAIVAQIWDNIAR